MARNVAIAVALLLMGAAPPLRVAADWFETVEINTFGGVGSERAAIIYRDPDGTIADWRWWSETSEPQRIEMGYWRYVAIWNDAGKPRMVYCRFLTRTRTLRDQELEERAKLPEHKRRRLSK